jgi:selenophosphate synthase
MKYKTLHAKQYNLGEGVKFVLYVDMIVDILHNENGNTIIQYGNLYVDITEDDFENNFVEIHIPNNITEHESNKYDKDIKQCPYCGGVAHLNSQVYGENIYYYVQCEEFECVALTRKEDKPE